MGGLYQDYTPPTTGNTVMIYIAAFSALVGVVAIEAVLVITTAHLLLWILA